MLKLGYMSGTDARLLSKLAAAGVETVPLGNGWDNHGMYVGHVNKGDGFGAVVGYLHKFVPLKGANLAPADLGKACLVNKIPVFVLADKADHEPAKKVLGDMGANVKLVDPADAAAEILALAT